MREISCETIAGAIEKLCIEAAVILPPDVRARIDAAAETEASPNGRAVLKDLYDNFVLAEREGLPVCQDTGMAVVFAELGAGDDLTGVVDALVATLLEQRQAARAAKDWATADAIRDSLAAAGLKITDTPAGARWSLEK